MASINTNSESGYSSLAGRHFMLRENRKESTRRSGILSEDVGICCEAHQEKIFLPLFQNCVVRKEDLGNGVSHCGDRIQGLCCMGQPSIAADLQRFMRDMR